jgi:hypothetical protein
MYNLRRFLNDYDMTMLRALAQSRGARLSTNRQAEAADELAALLLEPLSLRMALTRLSPQSREALEVIQAAGGRMRAPYFARRFGEVRPTGPGRLEREAPWKEPASPAEELWYAGLIFRAFSQDESVPGEFVFVPDDLQPLLPQPRLEPPAFSVDIVAPPARQDSETTDLGYDLFSYLVYLQNHDVQPYADGRLGRRDLAALRARLGGADERRLAFMRHLAGRLGFVLRQDKVLRLEASSVKRWLTATTARQATVLQEAWRDDPTWNDLCHVPTLVCDQQTPWRNDPVATRQALLALLARCPLDRWWSSASFVAAVKEIHPDFQRPDGDYASWYIRDTTSGDYLSGFESWDRVEGALIADLLSGPLHWLGLVTTVSGEADSIYRLTAAGAHFLGLLAGEPDERPSPPIVVRPDFQITVPPLASLYTRFQLERFTDPSDPSPSRRGPASQEPWLYRLTVGSLGRALAQGIQVEQVLAFLRQASERPVPANVAGQLRLWAGRFGQVQLEEVAILRFKNERVLKELSVLPETRSLLGEILSPTSVLVRKQDLGRLRKELRALGYLPPEAVDDLAERG